MDTTKEAINPNISKWNILFDNNKVGWILFQPRQGDIVYPCYSCRDIFSSKNSFLDHVNRRSLHIKHRCFSCPNATSFIFYNPCAFLLHVRQHFALNGGTLNLFHVEINRIPIDMAGFLPHPKAPTMYDVDNEAESDVFINSRFYNPHPEDRGRNLIRFVPKDLLFLSSVSNNVAVPLALRQICLAIPKCKFVIAEYMHLVPSAKAGVSSAGTAAGSNEEDSSLCPECHELPEGAMSKHFLLNNKPNDEKLKCLTCKFIAPSTCCLRAHVRLHKKASPFVCPECGRRFGSFGDLHEHTRDVCLHLAKQVKFRCPGRNCSKVYSTSTMFACHFHHHIKPFYFCNGCKTDLYTVQEKLDHNKEHGSGNEVVQKKFICMVCCKEVNSAVERRKHVEGHASDREACFYVYICSFCKSTFRSALTYTEHLQKCPKHAKNILENVVYPRDLCFHVCLKCNTVRANTGFSCSDGKCTGCNENLKIVPVEQNVVTDFSSSYRMRKCVNKCLLCNCVFPLFDDEAIVHARKCRCINAVVRITVTDYHNGSTASETSSSSMDGDKVKTKKRPSGDTARRKKRVKQSLSPVMDFKVEEPQLFDGTYHCKFCNYTNDVRAEFHSHIKSHREDSVLYQCMECGDCFVVKPSFSKHLMYFHQIADIESYIEENDCLEKEIKKEPENNYSLYCGDLNTEPKENQCRVCMQQFSDGLELNHHFRTHGMAFLSYNKK